jgi:hypothetical protein
MQVSLAGKSSELRRAWRVLGSEQRVAAAGSLLLIVSTFGPFTWVEAAEILTALAVLLLLKRRADGVPFHLPFGDGTAIAAAGAWAALLILIRLFDRPLGQNLLALACAALIFGAGMRERAKRPMDDIPEETVRIPRRSQSTQRIPRDAQSTERIATRDAQTDWLEDDEAATKRLSEPPDRGSGSGPPQQ